MDIMRENGAYGAGMSSFGPTVFAVAEDPKNIEKAVSEYMGDTINGSVFITRAGNSGVQL